jgi:hypothetical protein
VSAKLNPPNKLAVVYRIILTVIAVAAGVITILSFAFPSESLIGLRGIFVEWTVILLAFALLLGVVNVLQVHARRIQERQGTVYSLVLLVAFLAVFIPGMMPAEVSPETVRPYLGPTGRVVDFSFRYVQRPLQATMFSLLALLATTAAWRAFRQRTAAPLMLVVACVVVLLGSMRLNVGEWWALVVETRNWIMNVPVLAGARGILLGIVLGTIVAGVRLLVGVDRPYSD